MKTFIKSLAVTAVITTATLTTAPLVQAQGVDLGSQVQSFFEGAANQVQRLYLQVIPGPKSGEAVLQQSLVKLEDVTTFQFDSDVNIEMLRNEQSLGSFSLNISGPSTVTNVYEPANSKQQLHLEGTYRTGEDSTTIAGDLITTEDAAYVMISQAPESLSGINVSSITNQWMMMDKSFQMMPPTNEGRDFNIEAETQEELTSEELTPEQQRQLEQATKDLFRDAEISPAQKEMREENQVFVINITLPDEAILDYLERVAEITNKMEFNRQEIADSLAPLSPITATVWVDRSSFYLRHLETDMQISDESRALQNPLSPTQQPDTYRVRLSLNLSQFNEPVEITIPDNAQPAEEVVGPLMGAVMFGQDAINMIDRMDNADFMEMEQNFLMGEDEMDMMPTEPTTGVPELPEMTDQQRMIIEQYGL